VSWELAGKVENGHGCLAAGAKPIIEFLQFKGDNLLANVLELWFFQ